MLEDFDKNISIAAESLARKLNRRKMMTNTIKGVFATVAAATIGQFANIGQAFAVSCTCDDNWTNGSPCNNIGYPCPSTTGCPSGCAVCTNNDCGGWCNYSTGSWISCTGLGTCGNGYKKCVDCKCAGTCSKKCTCLGPCICCNCCSAQDIRDEMHRLAALSA